MTAIILAGGKATRLGGRDKGLLKVGRQTLISRQLRLLKKIFKKIIVVTNAPDKYKNLKGVKIISDVIPHQGPLGGIYSGLLASKTKYNFVFACDMPFINSGLINYMADLKKGFDAVVPKINKGYETLFAMYSKNCIAKIRDILNTDNLRVTNFFKKIKLKEISEEELLRFQDPKILFMNINTQEGLIKVKKVLKDR